MDKRQALEQELADVEREIAATERRLATVLGGGRPVPAPLIADREAARPEPPDAA